VRQDSGEELDCTTWNNELRVVRVIDDVDDGRSVRVPAEVVLDARQRLCGHRHSLVVRRDRTARKATAHPHPQTLLALSEANEINATDLTQ
jgi:hypothetical protein